MDKKEFYAHLAPKCKKEGYSKILNEHWCQLENGYIVFYESGITYSPEEAAIVKQMDKADKIIIHQIKANCLVKGLDKPLSTAEQKQLL